MNVAGIALVRIRGAVLAVAAAFSVNASVAAEPMRALIAEITVSPTTFKVGDPISMRFTVVNWSTSPADPGVSASKIVVNGKELSQSSALFGSTPRRTLKNGESTELTKSVGPLFDKPGTYTVSWIGSQFRANTITLTVFPAAASAPVAPAGVYGAPTPNPYGMQNPNIYNPYTPPPSSMFNPYGYQPNPMYNPYGSPMYGGQPVYSGQPMYGMQPTPNTRKFTGRAKDGVMWVLDLGNPEPGSESTNGWLYDERREPIAKAHTIPANLKVVLKTGEPAAQVYFHDLGNPKRGKGEAKLLSKDGYLIWQMPAGKSTGQDHFPNEVQLTRIE